MKNEHEHSRHSNERGNTNISLWYNKIDMALRDHKNLFIIVLFALLAAVGLLLVVHQNLPGNKNTNPTPATPPPIPPQPPLVYAEQGQLTPGFPKELILDKSASLANSYAVNYNQNLNQYTASFDSAQSMLALYAAYNTYFANNGWTIGNQVTKYPTSRGIYATKGNTEVSVAIMAVGKKSQTLVNYIIK